jgi:hypothetical protein
MPMPPYSIPCQTNACRNVAVYKIAARWSDGLTQELKTFSLSCSDCLSAWFRSALAKQAACHLAKGETLEPPGIYNLARGVRDKQILRQVELEQQLLGG